MSTHSFGQLSFKFGYVDIGGVDLCREFDDQSPVLLGLNLQLLQHPLQLPALGQQIASTSLFRLQLVFQVVNLDQPSKLGLRCQTSNNRNVSQIFSAHLPPPIPPNSASFSSSISYIISYFIIIYPPSLFSLSLPLSLSLFLSLSLSFSFPPSLPISFFDQFDGNDSRHLWSVYVPIGITVYPFHIIRLRFFKCLLTSFYKIV